MKKIVVGVITATSGIKGYVRLQYFTYNPQDIMVFSKLYGADDKELKIKKIVSFKGNIAVVEIVTINSVEDAQKLIGMELRGDKNELPEISEDEFYYVDLIGSDVLLEDGKKIGKVLNVVNYGASDILEVETDNGVIMYPFTDDFIVKLKEQQVIVKELLSS